MINDNDLNNISYFIGFSAPLSNKYMLVNNFLANYYNHTQERHNQCFSDFSDIVSFDFGDEVLQDKIKLSFEHYIQAYTGISKTAKRSRKQMTILPINRKMLVRYTSRMRNIIYNILNPESDLRKDEEIRDMIDSFLYPIFV